MPPPLPCGGPPGDGLGEGVGAGVGVMTNGKFKNPPRRIKDVLEETPVPAWPRLLRKLKPVEVVRVPPVSTTPASMIKLVEVALSAKTK